MRFVIGLAGGNFVNNDNPLSGVAQSGIAIKYDPVAGDTGWVGWTKEKTGSTTNTTAVIASIAASTVYHLKIRVTPTQAFFSVNGSTEVPSSTTAYPAAADSLYSPKIYLTTTGANTRTFEYSRAWAKWGTKGY